MTPSRAPGKREVRPPVDDYTKTLAMRRHRKSTHLRPRRHRPVPVPAPEPRAPSPHRDQSHNAPVPPPSPHPPPHTDAPPPPPRSSPSPPLPPASSPSPPPPSPPHPRPHVHADGPYWVEGAPQAPLHLEPLGDGDVFGVVDEAFAAWDRAGPVPASLVAFAEAARPGDDAISESAYLFFHGHCDDEARAALLPGEAPQRVAAQHRPAGSVVAINKLPPEMRTCPCNCSTRNASGEMDQRLQLAEFVRLGWLTDGEPLLLVLPCTTNPLHGPRAPVVTGHFFHVGVGCPHPHAPGNAGGAGDAFRFVDAATGEAHCCPAAWAYAASVMLCSDGVITDTTEAAHQVRVQLQLSSHATKLVVVQTLNVTLWQMSTAYRHAKGMARAAGSAARIQMRAPDTTTQFETRDALAERFRDTNTVRFETTNLWMAAQVRRIRRYAAIIEGMRHTIAALRRRPALVKI